MEFLKLCLMLTTAAIAAADICRDAVCEYTFEVHRSRSMTYRAPNRRRYNVAFNGTGLQVNTNVGPSKRDGNIIRILYRTLLLFFLLFRYFPYYFNYTCYCASSLCSPSPFLSFCIITHHLSFGLPFFLSVSTKGEYVT